MESAISSVTATTTNSLFTISKALNRAGSGAVFSRAAITQHCVAARHVGRRIRCVCDSFCLQRSAPFGSVTSSSLRILRAAAEFPIRRRIRRASCFAASFSSGGGSGGFGGENGGWGDGGSGSDGGDAKSKMAAKGAEDVSAIPADVIVLDVRGMTCGGCAASVKRILESQPQVSSASVNLTTETAIVWPVAEAKVVPDWQQQLGEALAKHLTNCGFKSNLRASGGDNFLKVFAQKMDEKQRRLRESGRELAFSWALCAVCLFGHLSHFFGAKAAWIHAFHSTGFHLSLSLFTLLGPGRKLILDGMKSLIRGSPNMNTLVGLGALSSFTVSTLAAFIPKLEHAKKALPLIGWKTFFEEPIMLIAFVLLGRNLEQRAKIKATSDMTGLLGILPSKARLLLDNDEKESSSTVEVPCNSLSVGDLIVVLPGDRVPVDGIVRAGRSTIDESSFTGEPLPVTKLPGSQVAAGSINLNGTLTVEVRKPGGETAMGDIVRLVEEAQSREAPVQRLADKVSGRFTYGVMALSAATFLFWSLFGSRIVPAALHQGTSVSLALQLSCSVLVIACPCALGLATPTAMLVGTSLGARRGLLLRGGNILEKFSMVNSIVFDKTGTLTVGRPVVTKVVTASVQQSSYSWSEEEVLRLAAGVEVNTVHPIGKAIVEASQAINCQNVKVADGTFIEEPGSGAVAIIDNKKVSVGTLDWVQRNGVNQNPFQVVENHKNQSVVYVGVDNDLAGLIYFEDQIREDARQVVESLTRQGINVYMLSGDKRNTAEYVASVVGIPKEQVLSEVKPEEKKLFVSRLQEQNIVAMVGDGINDAAALASSHIGIAMGGGVGAASDVSSIVLMGNRLSQVGIPIAAGMLLPVTGALLTPSIAGALMGLSSIGVTLNSLLLRFRFSENQKQFYGSSANAKDYVNFDLPEDREQKGKHHISDARWKGA